MSNEPVRGANQPRLLIDFSDNDTISSCQTMSDTCLGGFSTVQLSQVPATATLPMHAHLHGSISTELPRNDPQIQQTGFAGWRNRDRPWTVFGKSLWDLDPYAFLALTVKSDGRKYFVNIQTESVVYEDLHQHRLLTKTPGQWETVFIDLGAFVRTNHGLVVEPQKEMLVQKIRTIGMSLTDRVPGPYNISISKIWATVRTTDKEVLEDRALSE